MWPSSLKIGTCSVWFNLGWSICVIVLVSVIYVGLCYQSKKRKEDNSDIFVYVKKMK